MRTLADNGRESNDSTAVDLEDVLKKVPSISSARTSPRRSPIITPDLSTPATHARDTSKLSNRSFVEIPSPTWSMSTDVPQIDLRGITSQNPTPTNENLTLNQSISSDEQRSIPNTPIKTMQTQSSPSTNVPPARSFVALFDYDPQVMSPNQDSEEELAFKKGQIIKVTPPLSIDVSTKDRCFRSTVNKMPMDFIVVVLTKVELVMFRVIWLLN